MQVLDGTTLAYTVPAPAHPSCMCLWMNNGGDDGCLVLLGCRDGKLALLRLPTCVITSNVLRVTVGLR